MLKENTDLMYDVIEKMDSMVRVMDGEDNIIYMNRSMRNEFGDLTGGQCFELLQMSEKCRDCVTAGCQRTGKTETKDIQFKGKHYRIFASPVRMKQKRKKDCYSIEIFYDITNQKKMEEENQNQYFKLKEDIQFAKQVQSRVLPEDGIYWDAMEIASAYQPSEDLSGDLFDVVKIDDNRSLIYIADVSGHGVRSSLLTIFLRQVIRGMEQRAGDLSALLDQLIQDYNGLRIGMDQYFTILCALYDKKKRTVTFINGGHNCLPLILRKDGIMDEVSIQGLPICALIDQAAHKTVAISVNESDRLILYTDGIVEASPENVPEYFGTDRLLEMIGQNKEMDGSEMAHAMIRQASLFAGKKASDDMAALIVKFL